MTSTALGAETKKEEKIIFISNAHEKFYYEKFFKGSPVSRYFYHKALCYCLGSAMIPEEMFTEFMISKQDA